MTDEEGMKVAVGAPEVSPETESPSNGMNANGLEAGAFGESRKEATNSAYCEPISQFLALSASC